MKATLLMYLKAAGVTKAGDSVLKASIRKASSAPLEIDLAPEDLPEEFKKITIAADKTAIKEALKAGKTFEWARMGERSEYVSIG